MLVSTLAGLIAMTHPPSPAQPAPGRRGRSPNQGARWAGPDEERLIARYRAGARLSELAEEFGRSPGGIRARLELLGELPPGGHWGRPSSPAGPATTPAAEATPAPPPPTATTPSDPTG